LKNGVFRLFPRLADFIKPLSNKAIRFPASSHVVSFCFKKNDAGYNAGYKAKKRLLVTCLHPLRKKLRKLHHWIFTCHFFS
jgi:hypothetical protein